MSVRCLHVQAKDTGADGEPQGQPINAHWPEDIATFNKAVSSIQHENASELSALLISSSGAVLHSADANGAHTLLLLRCNAIVMLHDDHSMRLCSALSPYNTDCLCTLWQSFNRCALAQGTNLCAGLRQAVI